MVDSFHRPGTVSCWKSLIVTPLSWFEHSLSTLPVSTHCLVVTRFLWIIMGSEDGLLVSDKGISTFICKVFFIKTKHEPIFSTYTMSPLGLTSTFSFILSHFSLPGLTPSNNFSFSFLFQSRNNRRKMNGAYSSS